jgi:hypothetical protein
MTKGPKGPFFVSSPQHKNQDLAKSQKKKPDKCLALSFEGAFKANLQRGTLSARKWEEETQR